VPRFTQSRDLLNVPQVSGFRETILQSAIRRHLSSEQNLQRLLSSLDVTDIAAVDLEILGEKALAQGHIDLLLKQRVPLGSSIKIPIEVKTKKGQSKDVAQLEGYMDELRGECPVGVLVAADFKKQETAGAARDQVKFVQYRIDADLKMSPTFEEIYEGLTLQAL